VSRVVTECGGFEVGFAMADENIIVRANEPARLETGDFERVLERLVVIASEQKRGFLAYLLTMALTHLRDENPQRTTTNH
jgi:hypothetical protein